MFPRSSGVLLHVSSLPGPFGIGDLGPAAYRFVDFLETSRQRYWQVLPLVPVGFGDSPYASPSTFAGNTAFLSPELLEESGLLARREVEGFRLPVSGKVSFSDACRNKRTMVSLARNRFMSDSSLRERMSFTAFCAANAKWLDDYALFMAIKYAHGERAWTEWPTDLRDRKPAAIDHVTRVLRSEIIDQQFGQFLFFNQWESLKSYCTSKGIEVVGDLPIYVAHDSADVWSNAHLFSLHADGTPTHVAGVPPDYFSEDGQRWGNPIYRWQQMADNGFSWWTERMRAACEMYDVIRLDHFRGFEAYWEVPTHEPTARNGRWVAGPGRSLFDALHRQLGELPVIAEDLGVITDGVRELKDAFNFPGMAILQFAFDSDSSNAFLPHNFTRNLWAYTGTHDNETVQGWYQQAKSTKSVDQTDAAREYCRRYLGFNTVGSAGLHWFFVRALFASVANVVVIPLQDLMGLGSEARMNEPGSVGSNWAWRLEDESYMNVASRFKDLAQTFGRAFGIDDHQEFDAGS